jgi:hypothetical protein
MIPSERDMLQERVIPDGCLERFPTEWSHSVDKKSLQINKVEHVLIEKVDQLFRNML